jgi:hypothetical protein
MMPADRRLGPPSTNQFIKDARYSTARQKRAFGVCKLRNFSAELCNAAGCTCPPLKFRYAVLPSPRTGKRASRTTHPPYQRKFMLHHRHTDTNAYSLSTACPPLTQLVPRPKGSLNTVKGLYLSNIYTAHPTSCPRGAKRPLHSSPQYMPPSQKFLMER